MEEKKKSTGDGEGARKGQPKASCGKQAAPIRIG